MLTTRISSKGQLVLPKPLRDELEIQPGTVFQVSREGGNIVLTPLTERAGVRLYGRFSDSSLLDDLEVEHADEIQAELRS